MKHYSFFKGIFLITALFYSFIVFLECFAFQSELNAVLSTKIFLAQFYAFPALVGYVVALIALLLIIIYQIKRKKFSFDIFIASCLMFLISSVLLIFFGENTGKTERKYYESTINIVEWNVANQFTEVIAEKTFREFDADIAVFPELGGFSKGNPSEQRIQEIFNKVGIDINQYNVFSSPEVEGNIAPVTVIVKKEFSEYESLTEKPMTFYGTVYLQSSAANVPGIVGIHTAPPLPGLMDIWENDLNYISETIVKEFPNSIIIGDFNCTLKHGSMSLIDTHEDVLCSLPLFDRGTWPNGIPIFFRSSIDHILLPKGQYCVVDANIISSSESDHAAVFAKIGKK